MSRPPHPPRLDLVRIIKFILNRMSSRSVLENPKLLAVGFCCADHATYSNLKIGISATSGGSSAGTFCIQIRSRGVSFTFCNYNLAKSVIHFHASTGNYFILENEFACRYRWISRYSSLADWKPTSFFVFAFVRTDVSEEPGASYIRVTRIGELGTTQAATSNRLGISSQRTSVASCSLCCSYFTDSCHLDEGGARFLRKVGFYKSHMA
jgi:hypothetical protein